jgi:ATP-dependent Clp protease adaptor protein ClpS
VYGYLIFRHFFTLQPITYGYFKRFVGVGGVFIIAGGEIGDNVLSRHSWLVIYHYNTHKGSMGKDQRSLTVTLPEVATKEAVEHEKVWNVIVLNDPVNLMSYVVMVFQRVFGYSPARAQKHMLEVHHQGRSILFSGGLEEGENYVHQLQQWQLTAILEEYAQD